MVLASMKMKLAVSMRETSNTAHLPEKVSHTNKDEHTTKENGKTA